MPNRGRRPLPPVTRMRKPLASLAADGQGRPPLLRAIRFIFHFNERPRSDERSLRRSGSIGAPPRAPCARRSSGTACRRARRSAPDAGGTRAVRYARVRAKTPALPIVGPVNAVEIQRMRLFRVDVREPGRDRCRNHRWIRELCKGRQCDLCLAETPDTVVVDVLIDGVGFESEFRHAFVSSTRDYSTNALEQRGFDSSECRCERFV